MSLEEYLNQEFPRPHPRGTVVLKEEEVVIRRVGGEGWVGRVGWAVHIPKIRERYDRVGAKGDYFVKEEKYPSLNDWLLWTVDEDGNPMTRSVFSLGFKPK